MTIQATCACGAQFHAKDELAGKRVKCPKCTATFTVPGAAPILVTCACGQAFKAKAALAGKQLPCPVCQQQLDVPVPPQHAPPPPAADPLGTRGAELNPLGEDLSSNDPLELGNVGDDLFGDMPPVGSENLASATSSLATTPRRKVIRQEENADERPPFDAEILFTIATGVLAIYHGGSRIFQSTFSMILIAKLVLISPAAIFSLGTLMLLAQLIISGGILAGGIGVLMRRDWGLQVGVPASYAYFVLLALGFLIGLVAMLGLAVRGTNVGAGIGGLGVFLMVSRVVMDSLGPGCLIILGQQQT